MKITKVQLKQMVQRIGPILLLNGLEFRIDEILLMNFEKIINTYKSQEIYRRINDILFVLRGLSSRGFLNTINLRKYPLINAFLNNVVCELEDVKGNKYRDENYINGNKSNVTYKWIYCIIIINLYTLTIFLLNIEEKGTDFYSDLETLSKDLYGSLDPSLRKSLLKKGITVTHNIQNAFDTEYKNVDTKTNKLLSIQMSINVISYLKIQSLSSFKLSNVHTLTNKTYETNAGKSLNNELLEATFNECIKNVRSIKYGSFDKEMINLIEGLKIRGICYTESDDSIIFRFSSLETLNYFKDLRGKQYSIKEMIEISKIIGGGLLKINYKTIIELLKSIFKETKETNGISANEPLENPINYDNEIIKVIESKDNVLTDDLLSKEVPQLKPMSRSSYTSFTASKVTVTIYEKIVLIGHLNAADLSLMEDFKEFNKEIDILNKGFVTLKKPIDYADSKVLLRDTLLLAPGGAKTLSKIGSIYKLNKIELTREEIKNMDRLFEEDENRFKEYAMRDSLITLTHALWMEMFNFSIGGIGVPLTLSGIGTRYVLNKWEKEGYKGYQVNPEIMIGDAPKIQTPLGLNAMGFEGIGRYLPLYIQNYKGGRNESLMYGYSKNLMLYDWDLTSAYTTVLSSIGDPNYQACKELTKLELEEMSNEDLLNSFVIIKCSFSFPKTVKYPSIPVYVNETTTVYPLNGEAVLTGSEYILAKKQNCELDIEKTYIIPFSKRIEKEEGTNKTIAIPIKPFELIIGEIQSKRREFAKGTISNLMYKEIGNSIYGSLVRGINNKLKYDNKTGTMIKMSASNLSNPILASWVTAYIRSIIGECLHNLHEQNGKVISVTTDGFITDIPNVEEIMAKGENYLFLAFKDLREKLSGDNTGLELKTSGKGIISWTTRGQLGLDSKIRATTGFQNQQFSQKELSEMFMEVMESENKNLEYIQTSLRSAIDISKEGGHVTSTFRSQKFSMKFDNRRLIVDDIIVKNEEDSDLKNNKSGDNKELFIENLEDMDNIDLLTSINKQGDLKDNTLYDSKPLNDSEECLVLRSIESINKKKYNKATSYSLPSNIIKTGQCYKGVAIRNFIKNLYSENNNEQYNKIRATFKNYNDLVKFILEFDDTIKISKQSISNLVNRNIMAKKQVPINDDTMSFVSYVKTKFPSNQNKK